MTDRDKVHSELCEKQSQAYGMPEYKEAMSQTT
jgi:hypothetical protein